MSDSQAAMGTPGTLASKSKCSARYDLILRSRMLSRRVSSHAGLSVWQQLHRLGHNPLHRGSLGHAVSRFTTEHRWASPCLLHVLRRSVVLVRA